MAGNPNKPLEIPRWFCSDRAIRQSSGRTDVGSARPA
jgi:hypothetical protein